MAVRRKNASLFLGVSISFIASYMLSAPNVENLKKTVSMETLPSEQHQPAALPSVSINVPSRFHAKNIEGWV